MKKSVLFLFVLSLCSSKIIAQNNNGFMGKKNFLAADVRLYAPFVYGLATVKYDATKFKTTGSSFTPKTNIIDYGFNFTLGRAMTRNIGLMIQFSTSRYEFMIIDTKYSLLYNDYYTGNLLKANWLKAKTTTIMPIVEFTGSEGLLPLGLSHQFGFGVTKNQLIEEDYYLNYSTYDYNTGTNTTLIKSDSIYDYSKNGIRSYVFMYKINLRIPINDFLLFNLGFRYNINYYPELNFNYNETVSNSGYVMGNSALRGYMRDKEFRNILSLETGLSFCF